MNVWKIFLKAESVMKVKWLILAEEDFEFHDLVKSITENQPIHGMFYRIQKSERISDTENQITLIQDRLRVIPVDSIEHIEQIIDSVEFVNV